MALACSGSCSLELPAPIHRLRRRPRSHAGRDARARAQRMAGRTHVRVRVVDQSAVAGLEQGAGTGADGAHDRGPCGLRSAFEAAVFGASAFATRCRARAVRVSVTLEAIVAKLRASRRSRTRIVLGAILFKLRSRRNCCDCRQVPRLPDRTRCQGCYNKYAALVARRRRGGSDAPYRARNRDESCNCGDVNCDGMRCERVIA